MTLFAVFVNKYLRKHEIAISGFTRPALYLEALNMDPQFWLNLQCRYDLRRVHIEKSAQILARVRPLVA